jgi:hypothetical protein
MARRSNEDLKKLAENRERHRGQVPDVWLDFPLTKTEAKKADLKYYFTGDPCEKGHIALRWSANSRCLECAGYKDIPNTIQPYTEEEDEYLRQHFKTQTKAQMAEALGRTPKSVEKRLLSVLKLTIDLETRDNIRKQNYTNRNTQEREQHRGEVPDEWFELPPSLEEAQKLDSDYFFTGLACERGHIDIRGTNHRRCLACNRENSIVLNQDETRKEWRRTYRTQDHVREKENEYRKQVLRDDPVFKLRINVSTRISNFFAGRKSAGKLEKAEELLGCSYDEFYKWISNQLTDGMTIENYGLKGWHLDHVRPVMSFREKEIDTELEVQKVAFNWRNYQPLWGADNQSKNDDWTPQMEKAWIERMRSLGWEGKFFPCFEKEEHLPSPNRGTVA